MSDDPTTHAAPADDADALRIALVEAALKVRDYQNTARPRLSDAGLVRKFPGLGSSRTYSRLVNGKATEIADSSVPGLAAAYEGVLDQVELEAVAATDDNRIFEDLAPTREVRDTVTGLLRSHGNARLAIIQGNTGTGKTMSLRAVAARFPRTAIYLEAEPGWSSPSAALRKINDALRSGIAGDKGRSDAKTTSALLDEIVGRLNESRRLLMIDEAHELTPKLLNCIKSIINQTSSWVLIACMDTLWRRIADTAWDETRQLAQNRLYRTVLLGPPTPSDIAYYLEQRLGLTGIAQPQLVAIADRSRVKGAWSFARRVAEKLAEMPEGDRDSQGVAEAVASAITDIDGRPPRSR